MAIRQLLLIVFSSQLLAIAVADSNITEDAENALKYFSDEIGYSKYQIYVPIPNRWYTYLNNAKETIQRRLKYDIEIFTVVFKNLTEFANNVTSGNDCINDLDTFLDIDNYQVDVLSKDKEVFSNLLSLATTEVQNIVKEFFDLNAEFEDNCVENTTKCASTSKLVIAEAERLIPPLKRISYELLAEVHLLGYRLISNWEVFHATLVKDVNKVVQNATTCLAYTFAKVDNTSRLQADIEIDAEEPVSETYVKLVVATENAMSSTLSNLLRYMTNALSQCGDEYNITISDTRNAIFIANQTVNALFKVADDFNVPTTNCTSPNLVNVLNAAILRGLKEYTRHIDVVDNIFVEGVYSVNNTFTEISSLGLQVAECLDNTCDFLSEKLTKKTTTLPLNIYNKGNSTAVLLYQPLLSVLESGSYIVMDVIEQLEADIVALKSCIRVSLSNN